MSEELAAAINEAHRLAAIARRGREEQVRREDAAFAALAHVHDLLVEAQSAAFNDAAGLRVLPGGQAS